MTLSVVQAMRHDARAIRYPANKRPGSRAAKIKAGENDQGENAENKTAVPPPGAQIGRAPTSAADDKPICGR